MEEKDREAKPIETASATTSSDNSNSGPFAYVIIGVTVGIALVLTIFGAGCTSLIVATAGSAYEAGGASGTVAPYDFDDLEDMLRDYEDDIDGFSGMPVGGTGNGDASSVTVDEALDFDLAPYLMTIDGEVPASSYADVPDEVRSFVRELVSTDRSYSDKVALSLDNAAINEDNAQQSIAEALAACDEARQAIDAIELPAVGEDTGNVRDQLGTAKTAATRRWELMKSEISLLSTTGEVDTSRLWERDDEVIDATEEAADLLVAAMEASATR